MKKLDIQNVGLILEGGGMRGSYTAGVLDFFLNKNIHFQYIIGVSAGACNAMSYISKQKGRNIKVSMDYIGDKRYIGLRNYIKEGSIFGMNFIFNEIPKKYIPFDFDTFDNSTCKFLIGTTDCKTGEAIYFNKNDITENMEVIKASSSLPLISPILKYKNYELLDGGISDSIPILKAMEDGIEKNIIILTRNKDYRKSPNKLYRIIKLKYKKYPNLVKSIKNRYKKYNETLALIEKLEKEGKVFVLRPSKPIRVSRLETHSENLLELFNNGYEDAENNYEKMMKFLGVDLKNQNL